MTPPALNLGTGLCVNLGAGAEPQPGYVNVDRVLMPGIDLVADLDRGPWPLPDECAARILAKDVFEHLDQPILFMTECHRILQPGGILTIRTPHWRNMDAFTDPTHRRFPTEYTFDYWFPGTTLYKHNPAYGGVSFKPLDYRRDHGSQVFIMTAIKLPADPAVSVVPEDPGPRPRAWPELD